MRAEHDLLAEAATHLARAQVPADVADGLARTRLTALRKADGGVRGIATGDTFRRLVSRTLAKEWPGTFDRATRPYQFAQQARAGTDALAARVRAALAAHVRAALALRPDTVLVSLDGRRAYDCMSRAAFLTKSRLSCCPLCVCSMAGPPPTPRAAASSGWTRRWWGMLYVAMQQAVASTALGHPWPQPPQAASVAGPPLDRVFDLAKAKGPSRLPLRHLS